MNYVYVITYIDPSGLKNDVVEGVVQNELDFKGWLTQHNEQRKELDGNSDYFVEETEDEFTLKRVPFYTF